MRLVDADGTPLLRGLDAEGEEVWFVVEVAFFDERPHVVRTF